MVKEYCHGVPMYVFKWWLGDNIDQLTLFDDEELYNAFADAE